MRMKMARPKKKQNKLPNKGQYDGSSTSTGRNGQAVKRIPGVSFGEQKALTEQQQAAPLAKDSTPTPSGRTMPQMDAFGQTQRQSEPVTSGLPFGPGPGAAAPIDDDPDMLLRAVYSVYPDPLLLRLLRGKGV